MVLIHGITDSRHAWRPLVHSLAQRHLVLAVDLRGHGESDFCAPYDPASFAGDLIDTMQALELTNPLVVGHSLGGVVATAYAAMAPCAGVINVDQPLRLAALKDTLAQLRPMLVGGDESFANAIDMMFASMNGRLSDDEQQRLRRHRHADRDVVLGTWSSLFESTAAELDAMVAAVASSVTVPYLSLHGIDPGADYEAWLQQLIPTATVELWPDTGHYPHLVDPPRFLARVAEFDAQVRG